MQRPVSRLSRDGARLHLQHGPIDLILGADPVAPQGRQAAFAAAALRFDSILDGLVVDLPRHRSPLTPKTQAPHDPVAQRMYAAGRPLCGAHFLTPMIAVAGAVADEILAAMVQAANLRRAYVNNGGDIAVHLTRGQSFAIAMAGATGSDLGRIHFDANDGIGGVATSGSGGRSQSLGIADSVTVLAASAAQADAAATLIANAVDLPAHPAITRVPAHDLHPDSDLGHRPVVTDVAALSPALVDTALARGHAVAHSFHQQRHILGAALFLQGQSTGVGQGFDQTQTTSETCDA